ncbi:MAG: class I SAM-dependent methyltransferase [Planctomycetota bacterium]
MNKADQVYDDFWSTEITAGRKFRHKSWFRRRRYQWLSYLLPRLALKSWPSRGYHRGVVSISEGFFADLGCGLGACAGLYYASSNRPAVGVDASGTAIKFAHNEKIRLGFKQPLGRLGAVSPSAVISGPNCEAEPLNFLTGDVHQIPLKNNLFDTVYLGQVLEHVESEHRVLKEAVRILKPDGKLIITVPKENQLPSPYHLRIYTAQSLTELLRPYLPPDETGTTGKILFHQFDRKRLAVSLRIAK